ncbi:hypothetical protein K9M79_03425 [Candidatus Woesearchaeota archaeon]|nr:hypothetical protein [Candidatus Woesearchaeota archaeon]
MKWNFWTIKDDKGIKNIVLKFAKKCRRYEHKIHDKSDAIARLSKKTYDAHKRDKPEDVEMYLAELKKELQAKYELEHEDFKELENIKHYIQIVEYRRITDMRDDEKLVENLAKNHDISHHEAKLLTHYIHDVMHYLHSKIIKDKRKELRLKERSHSE